MKAHLFKRALGTLLIAACLSPGVAWVIGLRINLSESVPRGLWREYTLKHAPATGMVVALCPPDKAIFEMARERQYLSQGWCGSHLEVLFKPVAAVAGDVVDVTDDGICVNGKALPRSAALAKDGAGRPLTAMPRGNYVVPSGYVWLLSSYSPRSFDSRYFGPLPLSDIRGEVRPLWLWN
jgi:conjugative transfer signal peptidase TraF